MPLNDVSNSGYAAISGDSLRIFGQGDDCLLTLGVGGATAGDLLKSDANGAGVTASTGNKAGARALQTGAAGEKIRVEVVNITVA